MKKSQEYATAVALRELDYRIPTTLLGVAVRQFWFENTDKELATALVDAARAELR